MKAIKITSLIILLTAIILALSNISLNNSVYALNDQGGASVSTTTGSQSMGDMVSDAESFISSGKNNSKISASEAKQKILPIANILVAIATVVFLVVGGILGVQYMYGGADEKAGLKQKLIWFVIAVVLVYGATGIFNIAVNVMSSIAG